MISGQRRGGASTCEAGGQEQVPGLCFLPWLEIVRAVKSDDLGQKLNLVEGKGRLNEATRRAVPFDGGCASRLESIAQSVLITKNMVLVKVEKLKLTTALLGSFFDRKGRTYEGKNRSIWPMPVTDQIKIFAQKNACARGSLGMKSLVPSSTTV